MKAFQSKLMVICIALSVAGFYLGLTPDTSAQMAQQTHAELSVQIRSFWKWFVQNKTSFDEFEKNSDVLVPKLVAELGKFPQNVVVEIEPPKNGIRRMAVSADGVEANFPIVQDIVAGAPPMEGWQVVAFRQPGTLVGVKLEYPGITLETSKMWITPIESNDGFSLVVYFPDYTEALRNRFINASYILLDDAIGEYEVVKGIKTLDFQKLPPENQREGILPFTDLPKVFKEYRKKYNR